MEHVKLQKQERHLKFKQLHQQLVNQNVLSNYFSLGSTSHNKKNNQSVNRSNIHHSGNGNLLSQLQQNTRPEVQANLSLMNLKNSSQPYYGTGNSGGSQVHQVLIRMRQNKKQEQYAKDYSRPQTALNSHRKMNSSKVDFQKRQVNDSYYLDSRYSREKTQRSESKQGKINMKTNREVNDYWNGKERSKSREQNAWYLMDYYQQKVCFTTQNSPKSQRKPSHNLESHRGKPPQLNASSIINQIKDANNESILCGEFGPDANIKNIGIEKYDRQKKLNSKYFDSQLKEVITQDLKDQEIGNHIQFESRKKNQHEMDMNRIMYQSMSISNILQGDKASTVLDVSNISSNSKLKSYRAVGKDESSRQNTSMTKSQQRRISSMQSNLLL